MVKEKEKDILKLAEQSAMDKSGQWVRGIRRLDDGRIEIDMDGDWWQENVERLTPGFSEGLKEFTKAQAAKDCRLYNMPEVVFSNWSLIVNFSEVPAQMLHIDTTTNNYQFGLMMTPGLATLVADPAALDRIDTPDKLIAHLNISLDDPDFETLRKSLKECQEVEELLANFGDLLVPRDDLEKQMSSTKKILKTLDLIVTPGGVIHAGPSSDSFRAVLFCSACPPGKEAYDKDDQWTPHGVISRIIDILWQHSVWRKKHGRRAKEKNRACKHQKKFMFEKLAEVVTMYMPHHKKSSSFRRCGSRERFIRFVEECCDDKFPVEKRSAYISDLASKIVRPGHWQQLPEEMRCFNWLHESTSPSVL
jgi:hypothetical protein